MENRRTVLPLRVGEKAEARTFEKGYRGAWFRCKIIEIDEKKGSLLEYYDYDDDKNEWIKPYQVPPHLVRRAKAKPRELMLRPEYPLIYKEKQMHASDISRMAVVVDDDWKVGDLVDWWEAYCYWSGIIIKLLGNGEAELELLPKPLGEGSTYKVLLKDVRPSLNWSTAHGWTMPTQDGGQPCARLFKPINSAMEAKNAGEGTEKLICSSVEPSLSAPLSSNSIAVSDELKSSGTTDMQNVVPQKRSLDNTVSTEVKDAEAITSPNSEHHSTKRTSGPDVNSGQIPDMQNVVPQKRYLDNTVSTEVKDAEALTSPNFEHHSTRRTSAPDVNSGKNPAPTAKVVKELQCNCPPKFRASEGVMLNSARLDTMEAAVMDLEEYINKIKWMQMILLNGISPSDTPSSKWEFVDPNAASSSPK